MDELYRDQILEHYKRPHNFGKLERFDAEFEDNNPFCGDEQHVYITFDDAYRSVLTHGLPPAPTAHSGVDAIAQAIGGCPVANSSPLSVAFGLEACRHAARSVREAVADGSDEDARRRLSCASLIAGLAMNLSDCAADHALGQALGSVKHLPHGLTVGLVLAETLDLTRADCADRVRPVAWPAARW